MGILPLGISSRHQPCSANYFWVGLLLDLSTHQVGIQEMGCVLLVAQ